MLIDITIKDDHKSVHERKVPVNRPLASIHLYESPKASPSDRNQHQSLLAQKKEYQSIVVNGSPARNKLRQEHQSLDLNEQTQQRLSLPTLPREKNSRAYVSVKAKLTPKWSTSNVRSIKNGEKT